MDKCPNCGSKEVVKIENAVTEDGKPVPIRPNIYVKDTKTVRGKLKFDNKSSSRVAVCAICGSGYPSDEKI